MTEDFSILPTEFQSLIPYLKEWAISDDGERDEKIEQMSQTDKDVLINAVSPKFDEINKYLDCFGGRPMPEEATMIGSLAELVCELML